MAGDVASAWIAAGASIAVSLVSLGTAVWSARRSERTERAQDVATRELEQLKSRLSDENAAASAKRDYEYEARKRLYAELYPLAFQLHEAAHSAHNRILNLALATRGGWLAAGTDNWLTGRDPYYFTSVIYGLIAPLAIYELMTRKLTLLDLTLDADLHRQHFIARAAYEALRSDFNLIDPRYPALQFGAGNEIYAPPEDRPAALPPPAEQRWLWRQGLYSGQISQAVDALLTGDGAARRSISYAEFAKALGGADLRTDDVAVGRAGEIKSALRPMADVFRDFHPARRPITWRILLAQGACYRAIAALRRGVTRSDAIRQAAHYVGAKDAAAVDWIGDGARSIPPALDGLVDFAAEQQAALATADRFLDGAFHEFAHRYS